MPFTVDDFHSLVELIERHPEWRAELRRLVLTEELLSLPQAVRDLTATVQELAEAQRRTEVRLEELAEAQRRTEARLDELAAAQSRTEREVARLANAVADLRGEQWERHYREHPTSYFASLARRIRVLPLRELQERLDEAIAVGRLSDDEADEIERADIVWRGRRREDQTVTYAVVEVSAIVHVSDVQRAVDRAALLRRVEPEVMSVVAGQSIAREAAKLATELGVFQVLDGRAADPALD